MLIPAKYNLTPELVELLGKIEGNKAIVEAISIPPEIEKNIRRQSTLKSSLFSARIEGNNLTLDELPGKPSSDQKKAEVLNILKGLNYIYQKRNKDLSFNDILTLHKISMQGLIEKDNLGSMRKEVNAIFNSAGIAIYMPPPPRQINSLMQKLVKYVNSDKEKFTPIKAALAHYAFEKIHPFLDGNGRVGRLLFQKILFLGGFGMKGLISPESYFDENRATYYRMLEEPEKDTTDYLVFMLNAISDESEKAKNLVLSKKQASEEDFLLPRRAEILRIVKEQKLVSFDQIRRRFLKVNQRTLRYDIKKLADSGLLIKLGNTKGVYYKPSSLD